MPARMPSQIGAASLRTRVSQANKIYLRLPDGTLTDKNFEKTEKFQPK